jgi:hypothetical protein
LVAALAASACASASSPSAIIFAIIAVLAARVSVDKVRTTWVSMAACDSSAVPELAPPPPPPELEPNDDDADDDDKDAEGVADKDESRPEAAEEASTACANDSSKRVKESVKPDSASLRRLGKLKHLKSE